MHLQEIQEGRGGGPRHQVISAPATDPGALLAGGVKTRDSHLKRGENKNVRTGDREH